MVKNAISDYSSTAASNTDVGGVNIDEGMSPSGVNNAIRELMSHLADLNAGTSSLGTIKVDNLQLDGNAITSTDTNGNITLTPNGTGSVVIDGINYPQADGTANYFLKTDGAGQLSFAQVDTASIADDAITAAKINDNEVGAAALNVSGNGTAGQFLSSDGDGSMTWATVSTSAENTQTDLTVASGASISERDVLHLNGSGEVGEYPAINTAGSVLATFPNYTYKHTVSGRTGAQSGGLTSNSSTAYHDMANVYRFEDSGETQTSYTDRDTLTSLSYISTGRSHNGGVGSTPYDNVFYVYQTLGGHDGFSGSGYSNTSAYGSFRPFKVDPSTSSVTQYTRFQLSETLAGAFYGSGTAEFYYKPNYINRNPNAMHGFFALDTNYQWHLYMFTHDATTTSYNKFETVTSTVLSSGVGYYWTRNVIQALKVINSTNLVAWNTNGYFVRDSSYSTNTPSTASPTQYDIVTNYSSLGQFFWISDTRGILFYRDTSSLYKVALIEFNATTGVPSELDVVTYPSSGWINNLTYMDEVSSGNILAFASDGEVMSFSYNTSTDTLDVGSDGKLKLGTFETPTDLASYEHAFVEGTDSVGLVYNDASSNNDFRKITINGYSADPINVVGFATESASSGTCAVATHGVISGFTGLTTGNTYYIDPSYNGSVSTSGSTVVGKAISSTQIAISIY